MNEIIENLNQINNRIENACKKAGRNPNEVKLLLVAKTVPAERIKMALQAGHTFIICIWQIKIGKHIAYADTVFFDVLGSQILNRFTEYF